jgi:hypothetical protein
MKCVAPSPSEQGHSVSVRSRQWIVNDVRPSTLPPPALKAAFSGPQHLLTLASIEDDGLGEELQIFWEIEPGTNVIEKVALPEPTGFDPPDKLDAVRWGAASNADVRSNQPPFLNGIDIEENSSRLFSFDEPPPDLRAVRTVANEAAQGQRFMIPQNRRERGRR